MRKWQQFAGYRQHDAQERCDFLLTWLEAKPYEGTPAKLNIATEMLPSQRESSLPTIISSGAMLNFGGVLFPTIEVENQCTSY